MKAYTKFDGKKILIWGYGREGKSTEEFLKKCTKPLSVEIFEGKRDEFNEKEYDYIIKSPGIVLESDDERFTSQTEIFLESYRDNVIGITGTKGKSTTSALLYHCLKETLDRKVILLGNIGEPCLNYYQEIDEDTIVVFEMSCHQLAHTKVSPHVAVFLNIYEEHLDYYKTFEKYYMAKCNVTKYQGEKDYFYVGDQVPFIETAADKIIIKRDNVPDFALSILGDHNNYNALFAYEIATKVYGAESEKVKESLKGFTGLDHRLKFIGNVDGVDYYDDSISTIPSAAIAALLAVKNAYSIILGGMDRGINYDLLIDFIKEHNEYFYIFAYASGKRIFDEVGDADNRVYVEDLEKAVDIAKKITPKTKACLLSPASASYGYFKNFEERGDVFKELVMRNLNE